MKRSFLHESLLYLAALLLLLSLLVRIFFPPYVNLGKTEPMVEFAGDDLSRLLNTAPEESMDYLKQQIVQVKGTVDSVGRDAFYLDLDGKRVTCKPRMTIYDQRPQLVIAQQVVVKGVCTRVTAQGLLMKKCLVMARLEKPAVPETSTGD